MERADDVLRTVAASVLATAAFGVAADTGPELRGRIHLDHAFHDADATPLANGHALRRARLGGSGSFEDEWSYILEVDFAGGDVSFRDVALTYSGLAVGDVSIGHVKVPIGMDEMTSSNHLPFVERALPAAFTQAWRTGVRLSRDGGDYGYAAMYFGEGLDTVDERVESGGNERFGQALRVFASPWVSGDNRLHVGVAGTRETPGHAGDRSVRFSSRPESRPTGVRLVDTGRIEDVDKVRRLGLETGARLGPVVLQAERLGARVQLDDGTRQRFDGHSLQATWTLVGEPRSYRNGTFATPRPRAGASAWEVGLRLSEIDLDDGNIRGGQQQNITLGLNFYPRENVKFMANFIRVESERQDMADDPRILLFRTQVSF